MRDETDLLYVEEKRRIGTDANHCNGTLSCVKENDGTSVDGSLFYFEKTDATLFC